MYLSIVVERTFFYVVCHISTTIVNKNIKLVAILIDNLRVESTVTCNLCKYVIYLKQFAFISSTVFNNLANKSVSKLKFFHTTFLILHQQNLLLVCSLYVF